MKDILLKAIQDYQQAISDRENVYRHEHILKLFYRAQMAEDLLQDMGE